MRTPKPTFLELRSPFRHAHRIHPPGKLRGSLPMSRVHTAPASCRPVRHHPPPLPLAVRIGGYMHQRGPGAPTKVACHVLGTCTHQGRTATTKNVAHVTRTTLNVQFKKNVTIY